ncbi:MAG: glycosyltransferase family 39 protein [Acidobacteriaceae bacterium]|nr:glycosyltransferase family 39 protein [Acidobacteriaceae bacterium]
MNSAALTSVARVLAVLMLVYMAVLSLGSTMRQSPTFDEVAHIGAGLSSVQRFDLRMNPEHPPLSKALSGIAMALGGTHADYSGPAWTLSKDFFPAFLGEWSFGHWVINRWNERVRTVFLARLPMLLLTLVLGWVVFAFADRLGGTIAGLLCLAVYVSAPVFITFGPLVLTDIPIALCSVLSIWALGNLWRDPSRRHQWLFAASLAAAFLSKYSAGILLIGLLVSAVSMRWVPGIANRDKSWRKPRLRAMWHSILLTALLVYGFYLIFSWNQPTTLLERIGSGAPALLLRRLLLPPATVFAGAAWVLFGFTRTSFLLGHTYPHGIWFYYPAAFVLKSQLSYLALLLIALVLLLRRRVKTDKEKPVVAPEWQIHWRVLWVTLVVFVCVCMLSRFAISIRHFSVPMTLLILLLAPLPRLLHELRSTSVFAWRATSAVVGLLVLGGLLNAARTYPYYLPYLNALRMGQPAYRLLSDSNVDWNQSLYEVEQFVRRNNLSEIALDSYALSDDTPIVPQSYVWDCQTPTAKELGRWVIVSANELLDSRNCSWLLAYPSESIGGGSMLAFHMPSALPAEGTRGGPPRQSEKRSFLGMSFDGKAVFREAIQQPDHIPGIIKRMQQMAQPKVKPASPQQNSRLDFRFVFPGQTSRTVYSELFLNATRKLTN